MAFVDFADLITFTRASSATRVNASGAIETVSSGVPRFDYDPVSLAPRGLLREEQRTNYLIQSEFANGLPTNRGGPVSTVAFAGLTTGTGLALGWDGSATAYFYVTNYTAPASSPHTMSVFVRMDDGGAPAFGHTSYNHPSNDFCFNAAGYVISPAAGNGGRVDDYGGGLYRVSIPITTIATPAANCGVIKYPGQSSRTFKCSGFMFEAGNAASSYIPTTTSQVTRAADTPTISGTSFSDWFNQSEGTIVVAFDRYPTIDSTDRCALSLDIGSNARRMVLYSSTTGRTIGVSDGVTIFSLLNLGAIDAGTPYSIGLAYALNDFAACMNGGVPSKDTSGAPPIVNQMSIGGGGGVSVLNAHIRSIRYYPKRLPDHLLRKLTV